MTITVDTPDGGTAEFPDGTSTDTITSAMKAKFGGSEKSDDSALGQAGNFAYRAANTGTLHAFDYGLAGIHALTGGDDLATIRAKNEDYASRHPFQALGADVAGYSAGLGKLGLAARGAELASGLGAGSRLAQGLGTAGEAAGAGFAGGITGGESVGDSIKDATIGAAIGGPLGASIGGRARELGPALSRAKGVSQAEGPVAGAADFLKPDIRPPTDVPTAVLQTNKVAAYDALNNAPVRTASVGRAIQQAMDSLTPGQRATLSGRLRGRVNDMNDEVSNAGRTMTLSDLHNFSTSIGKATEGTLHYAPNDEIAAARLVQNFNQLDPRGLMDKARAAQGRVKDAETLDEAAKKVGWFGDSSGVTGAAKSAVESGKMNYSPVGRDAMTDLANAGPGKLGKAAQTAGAFGINHAIGALGGGGIGSFLGHSGIGTLIGAHQGTGPLNIGGGIMRGISNRKVQRAIKAARGATSTGQYAEGDMYRMAPWLNQAARQALYGHEAGQ